MPSWGALAYGAILSGIAAAAGLRFLLRERRPGVLLTGALAALAAPFSWNVILRHTGGDFFVDAPVVVFPISLQDTGSGVFATALSACPDARLRPAAPGDGATARAHDDRLRPGRIAATSTSTEPSPPGDPAVSPVWTDY
jgi:hypothetical protein